MTWPVPQDTSAPANYNALLGGKSVKSASFKGQFPITWEGFVEDVTEKLAFEYDPSKPGNNGAQKFWPDGNPVKYLWITLRTQVRENQDDDGRRVVVLDSKNKVDAVKAAVAESGADFEKEGYLALQWYGNDTVNAKNPDNPPKLYRGHYKGATLNAALGVQQAPPTPAAAAPQANWGGQAPAVSAPPATGGWGNPPVQQAPAAPAWGAQPAAPATIPAAPPTAAPAGQWGTAAPAPAPAVSADPVDPGLAEALRRKGVNLPGDATMQTALGIWAIVEHNPDVVA